MRMFPEKFPHQTKKFKDAIRKLCEMGNYQALGSDPELVFEWYLSKRTTDDFLKWKEKQRVKQIELGI